MSIHKLLKKVNKTAFSSVRYDTLFIFGILLATLTSFAFGRLSVSHFKPTEEIKIEYPLLVAWEDKILENGGEEEINEVENLIKGNFVASKNGSKYYTPTCGGVGRINEENKVWFKDEAEAQSAGYTRASGC